MSPDIEAIPMRQRELHRYHTLHLVLEHRLTGREAAQSLGLSLRQVRRLLARLRQEGRQAVIHGNRGRPSTRRLAEATRQQILQLSQGKYAGWNTTHLTEQLQAVEGLRVSRVTVHRLLRDAGAPPSRPATAQGPGGPARTLGRQPPCLAGGAGAPLLPCRRLR